MGYIIMHGWWWCTSRVPSRLDVEIRVGEMGEGCSEGTDFHACIGGLELLWAQECAIKIDNDLSSRIVECLVQQ
jgi:hypothetical protein